MTFIFTIHWMRRFFFVTVMFMIGGITLRHHPLVGGACLLLSLLALMDSIYWLWQWAAAYFGRYRRGA